MSSYFDENADSFFFCSTIASMTQYVQHVACYSWRHGGGACTDFAFVCCSRTRADSWRPGAVSAGWVTQRKRPLSCSLNF